MHPHHVRAKPFIVINKDAFHMYVFNYRLHITFKRPSQVRNHYSADWQNYYVLTVDSQCSTRLESQLNSHLCDNPNCEAPENGLLILNYTLMHKGAGKFNVGIHWELLSGGK